MFEIIECRGIDNWKVRDTDDNVIDIASLNNLLSVKSYGIKPIELVYTLKKLKANNGVLYIMSDNVNEIAFNLDRLNYLLSENIITIPNIGLIIR